MTDPFFHQKIVSVMSDNMYDRYVPGQSKGKLDMHRLAKVPTGSTRVFRQKKERKGKRYNVVLAVDTSGSMGKGGWGLSKIEAAAECAVMLERHFQDIGINTAIVTYNSYVQTMKPMGTKYKGNWDSLKRKLIDEANLQQVVPGTNWCRLHCNHDYDGLKQAYQELKGREGTNIVVVFSDGRPNCDEDGYYCRYDQHKHDFRTIGSLIHEHSDITTLGIGVLYEAQQIPGSILVKDVNDMRSQFIKLIEKHIKRG